MTEAVAGLLDTSVFIARKSGRPLDTAALPAESLVCVITLAELHAGVLAAEHTEVRSRRMATLEFAVSLDPLPVDAAAAQRWATLRVRLAEEGRRAKLNDLWIAAVAQANGLPVVSQDDDFDTIEAVGGPAVIRV